SRSGVTSSEDFRNTGHVDLELSQTSYENPVDSSSKPDHDESGSNVTLPPQPPPVAKTSPVHRHVHYEAPPGRRSYVLTNDNAVRMYSISNEEYSNLEKRL
ncbi:hypothetical protein V5O48_017666, partial [Marasmius crinis-equi]